MIYECLVKENLEEDVLIEINNVTLLCFSNVGFYGDKGSKVDANIELFDDITISKSVLNEPKITHKEGYQYQITGVLNIAKGGVDSLIFFDIDDLYDYSYLDGKLVDIDVIRLNISNI